MNLSLKLSLYRKYKNLAPEDIAKVLKLSVQSYTDLENGRLRINGFIAQKIADFYDAPVEFFLIEDAPHYLQAEVIYTNCTLVSGNGGASGYVNHQYNEPKSDEAIQVRNEEIKTLQLQVENLTREYRKLLDFFQQKS